jgi:hypothetical protein
VGGKWRRRSSGVLNGTVRLARRARMLTEFIAEESAQNEWEVDSGAVGCIDLRATPSPQDAMSHSTQPLR